LAPASQSETLWREGHDYIEQYFHARDAQIQLESTAAQSAALKFQEFLKPDVGAWRDASDGFVALGVATVSLGSEEAAAPAALAGWAISVVLAALGKGVGQQQTLTNDQMIDRIKQSLLDKTKDAYQTDQDNMKAWQAELRDVAGKSETELQQYVTKLKADHPIPEIKSPRINDVYGAMLVDYAKDKGWVYTSPHLEFMLNNADGWNYFSQNLWELPYRDLKVLGFGTGIDENYFSTGERIREELNDIQYLYKEKMDAYIRCGGPARKVQVENWRKKKAAAD
jgi:hypothetical protein